MQALTRLIVALLAGLPVAFSVPASSAIAQIPPTYRLYVTTYQPNRLQALDATTLTPVPGSELQIAPHTLKNAYSQVIPSANGSVLAAVMYGRRGSGQVLSGRDISVRVFAGGTRRGPVVRPPVAMTIWGMSPDGAELYGFTNDRQQFVVFSAVTGALDGEVTLPASCCGPFAYDAAAGRFYLLYEPPIPDGGSPSTPSLIAYDVTSGRQLGSLPLPGVRDGFWQNIHDSSDGSPILHDWTPGFALSPSGRQLAVLDGNTDTLTTVDTRTLAVESTVSVHGAATLLDRVLGFAGLAPTLAEAKEVKGTTLTMTYTPDGQSVLVSGSQGKRNAQGSYVATPLDLELVNVSTGLVQADRPIKQSISNLQFTPDGSALYAVEPVMWTVERLDPKTLNVTASRVVGAGDGLEAYLLAS